VGNGVGRRSRPAVSWLAQVRSANARRAVHNRGPPHRQERLGVSAPTLVRAYTELVHAWPQALAASADSKSRLKIRTARLGVNTSKLDRIPPSPAALQDALGADAQELVRANGNRLRSADHMRPVVVAAGRRVPPRASGHQAAGSPAAQSGRGATTSWTPLPALRPPDVLPVPRQNCRT
jgi:hypothetical protein